MHRTLAGALSLVVGVSSSCVTKVARAQPKSECVAAHADAQLLRKKEQLVEAKQKLALCAHKTCPALVQKDCTQWLSEVEADVPTIVVAAKDENGADTLDVHVTIDGVLASDSLDAGAIAVDPGAHTFVFQHGSSKPIEVKVVLRAGEKSRRIDADFSAGAKAPVTEEEEERRVPVVSWVLWGVGGAAMISWAYFGLSGRARENDLSSSCAPHCSQSDVDGLKRKYLFADVSLGVGLVSIAIGTVMAFAATAEKTPRADARGLEFSPILCGGGGGFSVSGSF